MTNKDKGLKTVGQAMKGLKFLKGSAKKMLDHLDDNQLAKMGYQRDPNDPALKRKEQRPVELNKQEQDYWENIGVDRVFDFSFIQKWNLFCAALNSKTDKQKWDWDFNDENTKIIKDMFLYFDNDQRTTLDCSKGLLIMGPVGTGKSSILEALLEVPFKKVNVRKWSLEKVKRVSCIDLIAEYDVYAKNRNQTYLFHSKYLGDSWNFDEFGAEPEPMIAKRDAVPLMANIIQSRYNKKTKAKMFLTTNLDMDTIAKIYGDRVRSRLFHMCNKVVLMGKDWRVENA